MNAENTPAAKWSIGQETASAQRQLAELVMAWAKDARTGEPRYVFELGEAQRGAHCGCVCYSCGLPLTAVNAAKAEWRIRPHFRHPDGAERDACLVLTARATALELLRTQDSLLLPARRIGATVIGASGKPYEAWVTRPAERVRIRSFKPQDLVSAILTLDDGREVLVTLTGSLEEAGVDGVRPVVQLIVDDPSLAGLDPDTLKNKLHLLVENGAWCSGHWSDGDLTTEAQEQAQTLAQDALDWVPDAAKVELDGSPSRETLLHWLAKEVLLHAQQIRVPPVVLKESRAVGTLIRHVEVARRDSSVLQLQDVRLEKTVGQVRPDVVAQFVDPLDGSAGQLLVEITVTNEILPERMERIRREGHAALEINISRLGGTVTRQQFERLVTEEMAAKSWLHHPWQTEQAAARKAQQAQQVRETALELAELRSRYISAAKYCAALRVLELQATTGLRELQIVKEQIQKLGEELELLGIGHAADVELFGWQGCILDRMLSIRENRPVGYQFDTAWQVLNTVLCEREPEKLVWHTLYLIALKAYALPLTNVQQGRVNEWRERVLESLRSGAATFRRTRQFDALLGLLFPEMKAGLEKPLPGQSMNALRGDTYPQDQVRGPAARDSLSRGMRDFGEPQSDSNNLWLRGAELEEWKRQNPDAARAWEQRKRT